MNIITVARFHEHCYGDRVRESKKKKKKKSRSGREEGKGVKKSGMKRERIAIRLHERICYQASFDTI